MITEVQYGLPKVPCLPYFQELLVSFPEVGVCALFQRLAQNLEMCAILGFIEYVQLVYPEEPKQEGQPVLKCRLIWLTLVGLW